MDFESISNIIALLAGGGGLGWLFSWTYSRRKEKAEAESAEAAATKELQDIYQQLVADVKQDRDEQKSYINELKEDRQHLRQERDDLRNHIDNLDNKVRSLERDVARNGRMVEAMRPFLCSRQNCPNRIIMTLTDVEKPARRRKPIKIDNDNCKKRNERNESEGDSETAESLS